jgi:hypothetical protein
MLDLTLFVLALLVVLALLAVLIQQIKLSTGIAQESLHQRKCSDTIAKTDHAPGGVDGSAQTAESREGA